MIPDPMPAAALVLDTNIVLDLFVFDDPAVRPLRAALAGRELDWVATPAMRDELSRVLAYPHLAARLDVSGRQAADVLADFDRQARIVETPSRAPLACADADDQKFVDLAVWHQSLLLSKDAAVLGLRKKLAAARVIVCATLPPASWPIEEQRTGSTIAP